jgi:Ca2+-binding RTX toxin-like protein
MRSEGTATRGRKLTLVAAGLAALACALPAMAPAREPIISYIDDGKIKLYDAELNRDIAPLPVPVFDEMQIRYAMSFFGRYVVYTDAAKDIHLYDRATSAEVPLPGINTAVNPTFLGVSDTGRISFDDNVNGPTVVYDSRSGAFIPTGFPANNTNRQPKINGNGTIVVTTCLDMDCVVDDMDADSDVYVQDLTTKSDTGFPDVAANDAEDPCISGNGNVFGFHMNNPMQKDLFIYERSSGDLLNLPSLNEPGVDDYFCTMSPGGTSIGFMRGLTFRLYDRSADSFVSLPARPFDTSVQSNQILTSPIAFCKGQFANIVGSPGPDSFTGTAANDVIAGLGGADTLRGKGGRDLICGNAGKDTLRGGKGRDRLFGGAGRDRLFGGKGRDRLRGGAGRDRQVQ